MISKYIQGVALLVGMIFGAGIFGLPYVFSEAGLAWSLLFFFLALFIVLISHILYAEIVFFLKGNHRFVGYTEILLGKNARIWGLLSTVFSYYGSLLIYGLLGGIFVKNIFSNLEVDILTYLFFLLAGMLTLLKLKDFAKVNLYLTIPLLGFVIYLFFSSLPFINTEYFLSSGNHSFSFSWFLPFGVWLFALGGYSSLPEVRDIFRKSSFHHFRRVILLSFGTIVFSYLLFIFGIWGVSGPLTTEDALLGLLPVLGSGVLLIGSLIGILAVLTSYLALSEDMRFIFKFDYKISSTYAWLLTVAPPVLFFAMGAQNFTRALSFIGTVGLGIFALFIVLMSKALRKANETRPEIFQVLPRNGELLKYSKFYEITILLGVGLASIHEIWRIF